MLTGVFIWACVLKPSIHATPAGVIVGLAMPLRAADGSWPAHGLEHDLHPWVAFWVLPIFAFANAGVGLADVAGRPAASNPAEDRIGAACRQAGRGDRLDLGSSPDRIRWASQGNDWLQLYG